MDNLRLHFRWGVLCAQKWFRRFQLLVQFLKNGSAGSGFRFRFGSCMGHSAILIDCIGPPDLGSAERGYPDLFRFPRFLSDLFRFAFLVFGNAPVLICSDLLRFLPITKSEQIRETPFCRPLLQVPDCSMFQPTSVNVGQFQSLCCKMVEAEGDEQKSNQKVTKWLPKSDQT